MAARKKFLDYTPSPAMAAQLATYRRWHAERMRLKGTVRIAEEIIVVGLIAESGMPELTARGWLRHHVATFKPATPEPATIWITKH